MDLQWFAAEDEGRTEEPSEYKIRKAREEGHVSKSQELVSALVLLLPALMILFLAPYIFRTCVEMLRFYFTRAVELDPARDRIIASSFFSFLVRLSLPIALTAMAAAVFANLVQTGPLFTVKPLTPNFSKIIPRFGDYFRRTLFSMEGLYNFGKSLVKMALIGMTAFFIIRSRIKDLANLQTAGLWTSVSLVASLAIRMIIIAALLLLVLSAPDILFQRWRYRESLKMTRQEVKEERRMYEGDPLVRSKLRQRMRELLSANMAVNVPRADVVITNPTHFAVALEYRKDAMPAPRVSAKGADELAQRIKRIALDSGVPIVENKPLARSLYAETEIGDIAPLRFWEALAAVLASVSKINEERRRAEDLGA
ncbi:MAG: flagellar biosynthesis protein FlhB [Spirochaetaceae bacterium]|nr:flagellar biosynthesis protein FlhB [Spirochaetaceae bacterium]